MHHRIYPAQSDPSAGSVSARNLGENDEADTDFLWHRTTVLPKPNTSFFADIADTVHRRTPAVGPGACSLDVRVSRRLSGDEVLLFHTELRAAPAADDTVFINAWLRCLVRF